MSKNISINESICTTCGRCVAICPSNVCTQPVANSPIVIENIHRCIACGHCVAACPTHAIKHSDFPLESIHKIDAAAMPTPEQVMLLCKKRRSNRAFSPKPITESLLDLILEAAHRAPTATNSQLVSFTLITDPDKLSMIVDYTIDESRKMVKKLENPLLKPFLKIIMADAYKYVPLFHKMVKDRANGGDLILRHATALLLIHTPKGYRWGATDANLAYQNGSLMAETLGINQFYTGFVMNAIRMDKQSKLPRALGIQGEIHAGMALGMPAFKLSNYIDKNPIKVTKIYK